MIREDNETNIECEDCRFYKALHNGDGLCENPKSVNHNSVMHGIEEHYLNDDETCY